MNNIIKQNSVELLALLLTIVNVFLGVLPVLPFVFIISLISLFRTGIIGGFFLTSYALPILLGSALYTVGITGIATIIQLLLFIACLYYWLVKKNFRFYFSKNSFFYFVLVIGIFVISALITGASPFSLSKLKDTVLNGVFTLVAFGLLFSNPDRCNVIRIGMYLIIYSFLMLLLSPLLNNGAGPAGFLDFGYLRAQNMLVLEEEKLVVDYQHVGFFATLGCGCVFLESLKKGFSNGFMILCIFLCTMASLYSGARQFIIISFVFVLLWVFFQRKKGFSGFIILIIGIALVGVVYTTLVADNGLFSSVKEEGYMEGSGRSIFLLKGIADFLENPIFGIGYGNYEILGKHGYPHNMFVEILCEMGVVGLLLLFLIVITPTKYLIKENKSCVYLLIAYFLRSMTSGGLDSNIMLFSFIFATLCLTSSHSNKNIQYKQYDNQGVIA